MYTCVFIVYPSVCLSIYVAICLFIDSSQASAHIKSVLQEFEHADTDEATFEDMVSRVQVSINKHNYKHGHYYMQFDMIYYRRR